jgi:hypothetical protein
VELILDAWLNRDRESGFKKHEMSESHHLNDCSSITSVGDCEIHVIDNKLMKDQEEHLFFQLHRKRMVMLYGK